ncbi:MAG: inositol monophosphatase [Patescibacteria group bacterium]|nr:inositol monophosphatase [Patescibacteria group bacterium]
MKKEKIRLFLEKMILAVRQAGFLAKSLQGKVVNEGKVIESFIDDSEIIKAKRSAKTIIDEVVQEILLLAAKEVFDVKKITLDAEEETPSVSFFSKDVKDTTLVIDPIDGTLHYLSGSDCYSICVGLIHKGKIISIIVYFPARDKLYFIDENQKPFVLNNAYSSKISNAIQIRGISSISKNIYKNYRVSNKIVECFDTKGYKVFDDLNDKIEWCDGLLKCLSGEFLACLFHSPQTRDILLGSIFNYIGDGCALDWNGKPLIWPQQGRVSRVLFMIGKNSDEILECLKDS